MRQVVHAQDVVPRRAGEERAGDAVAAGVPQVHTAVSRCGYHTVAADTSKELEGEDLMRGNGEGGGREGVKEGGEEKNSAASGEAYMAEKHVCSYGGGGGCRGVVAASQCMIISLLSLVFSSPVPLTASSRSLQFIQALKA